VTHDERESTSVRMASNPEPLECHRACSYCLEIASGLPQSDTKV
jgi:hypothetical protein